MKTIDFNREPASYRHWIFEVNGPVARLWMQVRENEGFQPGYVLKLNSYDLGVDLELADAVQRLRFEHPRVRVLVIGSRLDKVFSAGANIFMLQSSTHSFKVNFCKFTNETRLWLEELCRESGVHTIAALNGTASGGGYELAISCEEMHLIDDGNSAVSLPETPLLGVLPGTGGLTRLVDKRKVRRDLADAFCTLAEGCRGSKALKWNLVDFVHARSRFQDKVDERVREILTRQPTVVREGPGIHLSRVEPFIEGDTIHYSTVALKVDERQRVAEITVRGPESPEPRTPEELIEKGDQAWILRFARELDDALLQLRFAFEPLGLLVLKTRGDLESVTAAEEILKKHPGHWLVNESRLLIGRVLRRLEVTARSVFAVIEPESCFAGVLFELALAADRSFMLNDENGRSRIQLSALNGGAFLMGNGLTRLQCRFFGDPAAVPKALRHVDPIGAGQAAELGLVTFTPDEIDWEDEVRVAVEERASLSPDALTGMEANLRFPGPETLETKIFGRLSAWQNWIFIRPNATGDEGALTMYGRPERPSFDWKRT